MPNQNSVAVKINITTGQDILIDQFELTHRDVNFILDDKGFARVYVWGNILDTLAYVKKGKGK